MKKYKNYAKAGVSLFALDTCAIIELSKEPQLYTKFCQWAKVQKCKFYVCKAVISECKREKTNSTLSELRRDIDLEEVPKMDGLDSFAESLTGLGDGEIETIFFCRERKKKVITFDKKAINTCKILTVGYVNFKEKFMECQ